MKFFRFYHHTEVRLLLTVKRITKTEYLVEFWNPLKKKYIEVIQTRNDMKKLANNNRAFVKDGYFELFKSGAIDKLEISEATDEL